MSENKVKVGIACRLDKPAALELAKDVVKFLLSRKAKVFLENRIASKMGYYNFGVDLSKMNSNLVDFIVSVGGDGTLLRVAQHLNQKNSAPILGVNVGSIGFLDEANAGDVMDKIDRVIAGDFKVERATRLKVVVDNRRLPDALNEVFVCSSRASKILKLAIKVDGEFYSNCYSDGVLVSATSGSTAYSLSAGGALVDPRIQNIMQIVPVCPYARMSMRPIVVPSNSTVEISLLRPRLNATLIVDGQFEVPVSPKKRIRVQRSRRPVKFIRFGEVHRNFYERLRTTLIPTIVPPKDDSPDE
ncbi:MAG: NAD(+)/NADH kinase [Promethearchaeota archaeon]